MRKYIILLLMILTVVVLVTHAQESECAAAEGVPIRIGAVFAQGNVFSPRIGDSFLGAQAMLEAINDCGGINGRLVEWVYIPANDREEAEDAARTLIEEEGVSLIVGSGSLAVSEGLESVAAEANIVYWEVSETLSGSSDWAFTSRPSNTQLGTAAADFIETVLQPELSLSTLSVAMVHEARPRGQQIARGINRRLTNPAAISENYENYLSGTYTLAERIREERINVVVMGTFDDDADRLWHQLREANANIDAWIQVGSAGYSRNLCRRFGNYDGFISVTPTGEVSTDYREQTVGELYLQYRRAYMRANTAEPTPSADLAASGLYMLLAHILLQVEGDFTAENLQQAIMNTEVTAPAGLMGEGFALDAATHENQYPGVVIQQRQQGQLCTAYPEAIATCGVTVSPFPTWRERAIIEETRPCNDAV